MGCAHSNQDMWTAQCRSVKEDFTLHYGTFHFTTLHYISLFCISLHNQITTEDVKLNSNHVAINKCKGKL